MDSFTFVPSATNERASLTEGAKLVANAKPNLDEAQKILRNLIGDQRWTAMCGLLRDTTRLVRRTPEAAS
jgi:hypothetical protein